MSIWKSALVAIGLCAIGLNAHAGDGHLMKKVRASCFDKGKWHAQTVEVGAKVVFLGDMGMSELGWEFAVMVVGQPEGDLSGQSKPQWQAVVIDEDQACVLARGGYFSSFDSLINALRS